MASNLQALDEFPTFTGEESPQEQIRQLQNYLFVVVEQLKYSMANLGIDNLNAAQWNFMKAETLRSLTEPSADGDAANKAYVDKRTSDYIIEQGIRDNWTYRKWASGSCELWRAYQNASVTDGMAVVPLPFPIQAKSMLGLCVPGDYYSNASLSNHYGISQRDTENINIYVRDSYTRNTNGTEAYCNIYIKAIWT